MIFERLARILAEQFGLEEEFGIEEMGEEDIASIHNVGDMVSYLRSKLGE